MHVPRPFVRPDVFGVGVGNHVDLVNVDGLAFAVLHSLGDDFVPARQPHRFFGRAVRGGDEDGRCRVKVEHCGFTEADVELLEQAIRCEDEVDVCARRDDLRRMGKRLPK